MGERRAELCAPERVNRRRAGGGAPERGGRRGRAGGRRPPAGPGVLAVAVLLAVLLLLAGCATPPPGTEFSRRSLPAGWSPQWRPAAPGIDYARWQGEGFPPFHLVRVDLERAGVSLPPPFPQGVSAGELLQLPGVLGAVNGSPFRLRRINGQRRMEPAVLWIAGGRRCSRQEKEWAAIWYDKAAGRVRVTEEMPSAERARWAAGGYLPIVREGRNVGIHGQRHARTAAGTAEEGRLLYFLVIEGESLQNPGATSLEAGRVMVRLGVRNALNLDGGRSATLLLHSPSGRELANVAAGREKLPCFILLSSSPADDS